MICLDYSDADTFGKMQQDALRRAMDMQRRSRQYGMQQNGSSPAPFAASDTPSPAPAAAPTDKPSTDAPHGGSQGLSGLLGSLGGKGGELFNIAGIPIDEEKALIGLLIYILYKQGADIKLLLGLGYLLL